MTVWFTVQLEDKPGSLARVAAALDLGRAAEIVDHDLGALPGKNQCGRASDTRRTPGDDR